VICVLETTIKTKDGREVFVREPKKNDLENVWKFICKQITDSDADGLGRNEPPSLEEEKKWFSNLIDGIKNKKRIYLVLEHDGKVVGSTEIERKTGRQRHIAGFGIVIDKEFRRQGLGTRAIPIIIDLARERMEGLKIVFLEAFSYNEGAQKLYEKSGFKKVAVLPDSCLNKGKLYDKLVMYYYL